MSEENNKSKEQKEQQQPKKERRFDPELLRKGLQCDLDQYDRLQKCSKKNSSEITEWNRRQKEKPSEEIWLQGAQLNGLYLEEAIFLKAHLSFIQLYGRYAILPYVLLLVYLF